MLFSPSMDDDVIAEVSLTGVTPALSIRPTPPGGQGGHLFAMCAKTRGVQTICNEGQL